MVIIDYFCRKLKRMNKNINQPRERRIRIGLTHGDFNGISYEIIIKALQDSRLLEMFTPVIYGLSRVLSYNRKNLNANDFNFNSIKNSSLIRNNKINIINLTDDEVRIEFGKSNAIAGHYSHMALERAVEDLKERKINVVVTAPINKENIQSDSFSFPGHTEFFASEFGKKDYLMLMVSGNLRIGTITGHIPLAQVPSVLTEDLIMSRIKVLDESLRVDFGIEKPKIAVLGLNPHAGENGKIGTEEIDIIKPAIIKAKKNGLMVFGPFPADGFFAGAYKKYDGILSMYHDQGLIPFKTLAFDSGVNYTAGLPIVRTSPAHGTAYDIAGKNSASPVSLRSALYLGLDIYKNRMKYIEMNKNPLGSNLIEELRNGEHHAEEHSNED